MIQKSDPEDQRDAKIVFEKENIVYILSNYLKDKKLYLKGYRKKVPAKLQLIEDNLLKVFLPFDYQINGSVFLYSVVKKYIEFELKFIKTEGVGRHIFEPIKALIATSDRKDPRFIVTDKTITAREFKILGNEEVIGSRERPVSVTFIFEEYQKILSEFYPNLEINTFDEKDDLINAVYRSKKVLFIENTQKEECYFVENEEEIDIGKVLGDRLSKQIKEFKEKRIGSFLIYPVVYHRFEEKDILFAYIKIWSEEANAIDITGTLGHLNFTIYEMINKIRNSLMSSLDVEQSVLDIGQGGIKLLITSDELIDYFSKKDELVLDLQFNILNQISNVTLQGKKVSNNKDKNGNVNVGISFIGSEDKGFQKLNKYLESWQNNLQEK